MSAFSRFLSSLFCLLILLILPMSVAIAGEGTAFTKIVFFGDSLSDDGNLYAYDFSYLPKSPPYYEGRFSNNYVWSDIISKSFAAKFGTEKSNYAFGGETAIFHNPKNGFLPYSLTMSRNSYLLRTAFQDRSQTLFVIWIGANDYMHDSVDVEGLTTKVVNSIQSNIESLVSHGGVNFMVINLPDIGQTPFAKQYGMVDLLHQFTLKHNEKLAEAISELREAYPDINIKLYDIYSQFIYMRDNIDYFNKRYHLKISNLTASCWQGGYTLLPNQSSEAEIAAKIEEHINKQRKLTATDNTDLKNFNSAGLAHYIATSPDLMETYQVTTAAENGTQTPCTNPEEFIFWDHLHPTKVMHMLIAKGIEKFILGNYQVEKIEN